MLAMEEVKIRSREIDGLMNSFAKPEWHEGERGEIYAEKGNCRFEYVGLPGTEFSRMSFLIKNKSGGLDNIFELISREKAGEAVHEISLGLAWPGSKKGWNGEVRYGVGGERLSGMIAFREGLVGRSGNDEARNYYYPAEDDCPKRLDLGLTIALFIFQLTRLEFERPVLVPDGLYTYVEPEELFPGTWAFAPNITNAAKLYVWAQTAEEKRVSAAINRYVIEQEVGGRFH